MSKLKLFMHGARVRQEYCSEPYDTTGAWGKSTETERPDGEASGIVKRFKKHQRAHQNSFAYSWIKTTYEHAIEYTGIATEVRGLSLFFGLFGAITVGGIGIYLGAASLFRDDWLVVAMGAALLFAMLVFTVYMLVWPVRLELFRPADEPIIFDRRHRKVYRILRDVQPGLKGLFKPWPLRAVEYHWDLIDAEHNAEVFTTGGTVNQRHYLVFIVRKSATDPTIIDSFNIGNPMVLGEQTVACVWEHIRRFMEENGPHLPPGETVNVPVVPQTWWQGVRGIVPIEKGNFKKWLWEELPFAIFLVALFPLFVPMFLIWGTGNWLSYKTAISIEWPDEVQQAVGSASHHN